MTIDFSEPADIQFSQEIISTARLLRDAGVESEPAIQRTYLFPAEDEVRLIHVDSTIAPLANGEAVAPFFFAAAPKHGIPLRSAVALIAPEDEGTAQLPDGWGTWDGARIIGDHDYGR